MDDRNVGYASLTAPDSCVRELSTVRGGLVREAAAGGAERVNLLPSSCVPCNFAAAAVVCVQECSCRKRVTGVTAARRPASPSQVIYDDGNIPNLSALANIRSVNGPLIVYGNANASLQTLAGLEGIRVRGAGGVVGRLRWSLLCRTT